MYSFLNHKAFRICSCDVRILPPNTNSTFHVVHTTLLCVKIGALKLIIQDDILSLSAGSFAILLPDSSYTLSAQHTSVQYLITEFLSLTPTVPDPINSDFVYYDTLRKQDRYIERCLSWADASYFLISSYYNSDSGYAVLRAVDDYANECDPSKKRPAMLRLLTARIFMEIAYHIIALDYHPKTQPLNLANQYIIDNLTDSLCSHDIAEASNVSVSYLQRLFHDEYQHGIMTHVNLRRLEQSCLLLHNSKLSIVDIAIACGFNSRQHFAHSFKNQYHISPLQYRKANRNI